MILESLRKEETSAELGTGIAIQALHAILNPIFIFGFLFIPAFGIAGLAISTILIQFCACIYLFYKVNKTILKIYDPEEVSKTDDRLTCRGRAKLQSGSDMMIEFYIYKDKDGDRFIRYEEVD